MEPRIDAGIFQEDETTARPLRPAEERREAPPTDPLPPRALPLGPLSLLLAGVALILSLWNLWSSPVAPPPVGETTAVALTADQAARLEKRVVTLEHLLASVPAGAHAQEGDRAQAARFQKLKGQVEDLYQRMLALEQRLASPAPAAAPRTVAVAATPPPTAAAVQPAAPKPAKPALQKITYKVKRGDSLWGIAKRHGVKLSQLRAWNPRLGSKLKQGQRVIVYVRR